MTAQLIQVDYILTKQIETLQIKSYDHTCTQCCKYIYYFI